MLEIQNSYLNYLDNIQSKIRGEITNNKLSILKNKIQNQELLIPIIGGFSAGKSTLINMFLGDNILKVDITPETALATEIRYSKENYIEAISTTHTQRFEIGDIDKIKQNAKNYKFMRVYLNNENLKKIEPLVLVDMPGFDSPIDLHNEAILNYLDKGVHFIVLISVENGTIPKSVLRQLGDIYEFEKDFSFFLSKANLKPDSEVEEIKEEIEAQIEDELDISKEVIPIGNSSAEELQKVLHSINPDNLIKKLFLDELKNLYSEIESSLNTKITALKTSKEENEEAIKQLQNSIKSLEEKKNELIQEAKQRYSTQNIDSILSAVEREIVNSVDSLANLALKNPDYFEKELVEMIRSILIVEIKTRMGEISQKVVQDFAIDIKSNIDIKINDDMFSMITKNILSMPQINKVITTMLGGILTFIPKILNPIIGVVLAVLPHILSSFFEGQKEKKQLEEIKKQILIKVIPSIKMNIRKNIVDIFTKQIDELIKNIANQFEEKLKSKKREIEEIEKEKQQKLNDIVEEVKKYENIKTEIKQLTNEVLYKG